MSEAVDAWTQDIHQGDCFDVLDDLPEDSVHSVVTDPPYGLNFMGRSWDDFDPAEYQDWCESWARKCRRVLKPGGHLLAFSGNRTHHRLFTGVEDAGFEIRDTCTWHYGGGFPKALDVSKEIDKRARKEVLQHLTVEHLKEAGIPDAERTYHDWINEEHTPCDEHWNKIRAWIDNADELDRETVGLKPWNNSKHHTKVSADHTERVRLEETAPATDAAATWSGWKTCLKPATEFIVLARAPLSAGTVAENVLELGTGALNIAACRIKNDIEEVTTTTRTSERNQNAYAKAEKSEIASASPEGRYPSNVIFDETEAARLDREVGELGAGAHTPGGTNVNCYGERKRNDPEWRQETDSGGPSRYFYTSKASRSERTEGGTIENDHPTVKPKDLMEWLIKLVTREGQIVLDPFTGTGTTCKAAKALNRKFIGIEQNEKWADVARVRCGLTPEDPSHVRADDAQTGMEAFTDGGDAA